MGLNKFFNSDLLSIKFRKKSIHIFTIFLIFSLYHSANFGEFKLYNDHNNNQKINYNKESIELTPKYDKMSGLFGYIDSNGQWILKPQYVKAYNFSEGLAAVLTTKADMGVIYIDKLGNIIIEGSFTFGSKFKNDSAVVEINQKANVIDRNGNIIKKTPYYISRINNNANYMAIITDKPPHISEKKYGLVLNNGEIIEPKFKNAPQNYYGYTIFYGDILNDNLNNRDSFIIINDNLVEFKGRIESISEESLLFSYDDFLDSSKLSRSNPEKRYGFITPNAKVIKSYRDPSGKDYKFFNAFPFSENTAVVAINRTKSKSKLYDEWLYLKNDGTFSEQIYQDAKSFNNGLAAVRRGFHYGYIDKEFNWAIKIPNVDVVSNIDSNHASLYYLTSLSQDEYEFVVSKSNEIIKSIITDSMGDRQKLDVIYKYVTNSIKYDNENYAANTVPRISYSIYGALKYNIGVCEAYAELIDYLLLLANLESEIVVGSINHNGIGHAWNIVNIDGHYYHIDSTWDAGKDANKWMFYLRNDHFMIQNRTWLLEEYPRAERDLNNNFNKSN